MDVILLGEIEDKLGSVESKIDTKSSEIKTVVDQIKTYTNTNNTASETGILSQKLSYIIQQNKNHGIQEYKTAGTYTWVCPDGVNNIMLIAIGGSGGGGAGARGNYQGNYSARSGGSGGSGGIGGIYQGHVNVLQKTSYTIVVGAAGKPQTIKSQSNTNYTGQTEFNNDGTAGGQTKCFGIICNGGGPAGNGGVAGSYDNGAGYGKGGVQGVGGTVTYSSGKTNIILNSENDIISIDGNQGKLGSSSPPSGGASKTNSFGESPSGAGGSAGMYNTDASNGAAGKPGYVRIIW